MCIRDSDYTVHEKAILDENPLGVDLIIDATGSTKVISESMKLLKKGGTLLQYAIVHSGEKVAMDPVLMFNNEPVSYTHLDVYKRQVRGMSCGILLYIVEQR